MTVSCVKDKVLKYALCYSVWSAVLFALIFIEGISPLYSLNELQTSLTIYFTNLWLSYSDIPVYMNGNKMLFEHGVELLILNVCNGMIPILLYVAAVLSYPARKLDKIDWSIGGYFVLTVVNILRIYFITVWVADHPDSFHYLHDFVARYVVVGLTLIFFYLFVKNARIAD
ncbi:exosortase/archaeosortase family protein [Sulfurimonas sp.]|uniref:exosortase/archaeosortase family protein n=1 Tax=Sulfurimonas sp. TaxID=2022749 RepID=UPI003567B7BB